MIPSQTWFPTNLQERAAWYENFDDNIQLIGAGLGLTVPELASIASDNDVMQFLAETDVTVTAYTDAIRNYRKTITEGDIGDAVPDFPADIALTLPSVIPTGMFERLDNFVKRIRVSPKYTPETGALLGIIPNAPIKEEVGSTVPTITATVDPGNQVNVKFVRGDSNGIYIDTNVDNGGWHFTDKAVKSPATFDVPSNPANTPRGVQIRARFLLGNDPVGDWSDIVTVQTIP